MLQFLQVLALDAEAVQVLPAQLLQILQGYGQLCVSLAQLHLIAVASQKGL